MQFRMVVAKYIIAIWNVPSVLLGIAIIVLAGLGMEKVESLDNVVDKSYATIGTIMLIVFGIIVSLVSFFGCCGAIMENRCMILSYAILLIEIVIINLVLVVLQFVFHDKVTSREFYDDMMDSFKKHNDTKETKTIFVAFQKTFMCCGVDGAKDWGANIPESCCRKKPEEGKKCPDDDLFKEGCWTKISDLEDTFVVFGIIGIVIVVIQIGLIVIACRLASVLSKEPGG